MPADETHEETPAAEAGEAVQEISDEELDDVAAGGPVNMGFHPGF